jgi:hypothetical protein
VAEGTAEGTVWTHTCLFIKPVKLTLQDSLHASAHYNSFKVTKENDGHYKLTVDGFNDVNGEQVNKRKIILNYLSFKVRSD